MINRYEGEIRINPVPVLRNDDFNNDGAIEDIHDTLSQAAEINKEIGDRLSRLRAHLKGRTSHVNPKFHFAEGGYISMKGFSDADLLEMKSLGLIELYDFAKDRDWVKKYGPQFGLVWENGRAVSLSG